MVIPHPSPHVPPHFLVPTPSPTSRPPALPWQNYTVSTVGGARISLSLPSSSADRSPLATGLPKTSYIAATLNIIRKNRLLAIILPTIIAAALILVFMILLLKRYHNLHRPSRRRRPRTPTFQVPLQSLARTSLAADWGSLNSVKMARTFDLRPETPRLPPPVPGGRFYEHFSQPWIPGVNRLRRSVWCKEGFGIGASRMISEEFRS